MFETLFSKMLAIVLTFTHVQYPVEGAFTNPETAAETYDRRIVIANAVAYVASESKLFHPEDAAVTILTILRGESALEYRVHAGLESHIGTQDGGKARCLGQVQTWPGNTLLTPEEHAELVGTDFESTKRCAEAVLSYLEHMAWICEVRKTRKLWAKGRMKKWEGIRIMGHYATGSCSSYQPKEKKAWEAFHRRNAQWVRIHRIVTGADATPTIPLRPSDE